MSGELAVDLRHVEKQFGTGPQAVTAISDASFSINDQEFFTLLGPSGCGKTTLLRIIAGFEAVTRGQIFLFGEEIEGLAPNKRPINTVFQQYALFPHMSVADNVAFGLRRLKRSPDDVKGRVGRMLELVQMTELADRKPSQLSGGQQQRVALARALAPEPKVLLLDEPLSALDLKLRQAMRVELKQIQEETHITFVFVTHDQEEALTMSDRIAVMSAGQVQQIGTAREIYEAPENQFVADFIGETNFIDVTVKSVNGGKVSCELASGQTVEARTTDSPRQGDTARVCIRPEHFTMSAPSEATPLRGVVQRLIYLGTDTQHLVRLDSGNEILVRSQNTQLATVSHEPGTEVGLAVNPNTARLLVD